jgi:hypothetical protein
MPSTVLQGEKIRSTRVRAIQISKKSTFFFESPNNGDLYQREMYLLTIEEWEIKGMKLSLCASAPPEIWSLRRFSLHSPPNNESRRDTSIWGLGEPRQ